MRLRTRATARTNDARGAHAGRGGLVDALSERVWRTDRTGLAMGAFWALELVLLVAALAIAASLSHSEEWHPLALTGLLLGLALAGHWLSVTVRIGRLNASIVALVLAMALLGPAAAVAMGLAAMVLTSALRRLPAAQWLNNLSTFAVVPLCGALLVRALAGDVHAASNQHLTRSATFGLIVVAMFALTVVLNFLLVALDVRFDEGTSIARQTREIFFPMLSGQLATGALATVLVIAYTNSGLPVLLAAVVLLLIFRHLTVALLRSEDRAEQLEARTVHLLSLQFGVLRTMVRALGMRDATTARHSAAVARYARELAREIGCSQDEQETVHTAGLLHDIGKFTWPDSVLHADVVRPEDEDIVRRHPRDGAELVGALDGYGAVAEAILYHHERVDGAGYPAGLIGKEIPVTSRVLAICCIYDTMTKRASYRPAMSQHEAMAELRSAAQKGQLDGELVESFIALLEREGPPFAEGEDADFESELAFEQRVRKMAQPSAGTR